jgi:toxin ParE1/3/4
MFPVKGFKKHLIFYLPNHDSIEIVRLLHTARDIGELFTEKN